jgi:uncharacterized protein YecE (DUF72 family)
MEKGKIYIGTSGWHYKHWKENFYPGSIKDALQLAYFAGKFSTVEINNSFYRLPDIGTFSKWQDQVPEDFIFSVKGSRFITHLKKLNVGKDTIDELLYRAGHLKQKLGPILFQLPPRWKINEERFSNFLALLPADRRFAFEFRDQSWNCTLIHDLLRKSGCAFCIYELAGYQSPLTVTADFVYIRLHGPGAKKYEGSYSKHVLAIWAERCLSWQTEGKDIYLYFDNDQHAYAASNGQTLMDILK